MKKKVAIILLVIVLIVLCSLVFSQKENIQSNTQLKLECTTFNLPEGYYVGNPNNQGDANITNGTYSIFIAEYNESDINIHINQYKNYMMKNNKSVDIKNYTTGGIPVYESTYDNMSTNHFWFKNNNKVYSIYAWESNKNLNNLVYGLIKSTKEDST